MSRTLLIIQLIKGTNLIHNIIDNGNGDYDAAYRDGDYKLILGDPGDDATSGWYMTNGTEVDGNDDADVYLYDLSSKCIAS